MNIYGGELRWFWTLSWVEMCVRTKKMHAVAREESFPLVDGLIGTLWHHHGTIFRKKKCGRGKDAIEL